jgi:glycogen operon protein
MILAGDEMGRTQGGNNNAYCQDSPVSWVNWYGREDWAGQEELTRTLLKLRAENALLRPDRWRYHGEVTDAVGHGLGRSPIAWFAESGTEMTTEQWHDQGRRTLGMYVSDRSQAFLIYFHAGDNPVELSLPGAPWALRYHVLAHTGLAGELPRKRLAPGSMVTLPGRTVAVFAAEVRTVAQLVTASPLSPGDMV